MKHSFESERRALLAACTGLLCAATLFPAGAAPVYTFTDLGTPSGYTGSVAVSINAGGAVAGSGLAYDPVHAVGTRVGAVWMPNATVLTLPPDAGYANAQLGGINRSGQVSGYGYNSQSGSYSGTDAFIWSASTGRQALATPEGASLVAAGGLNDAGQVAGYALVGGRYVSLLWGADRQVTTLPEIGQGFTGIAKQVNRDGTVLVFALGDTGNRGFVWSPASGYTQLALPAGGVGSNTFGINSAGSVVGYSYDASNTDSAVLWNADGGVRLLGTLSNFSSSIARGINDQGEVVGYSFNPGGSSFIEGFVWTAGGGMRGLRSLLDPNDPEVQQLQSIVPYSVNDAGQIVGYATLGGIQHAFLLSPVPEASSAATLLAGLLALTGLVRRRFARAASS